MMALDWVAAKTRHALCGLHGHSMIVKAEPGRLYLRCLTCGAETAGWEIGYGRPVGSGNRIQRMVHAAIANSAAGSAHTLCHPIIAATTVEKLAF
jgi:hypothetical protein